MVSDQLTELEVFRMAVRLTEAALSSVPNALNVANREDLIRDRIIECHSAIQSAAEELLGRPEQPAH